jgi:VRR-NUC domain
MPPMGDASERLFQDAVVTMAKMQQWLVFHANKSSPRPGVWKTDGQGFPDLVLTSTATPSRGIIFVELKTNTGKLSPTQVVYGRALIDAGVEYHVWRPTDMQKIAKRLGPM